ncbi:MAG: malate synthase A [Lewinella sp.]|nr:malate synthase A [Lewinella sp.]
MEYTTATAAFPTIEGLSLPKGMGTADARVLTPEALRFLVELHTLFNDRRLELLERRRVIQQQLDAGHTPDFLPETASIRHSKWKVAPLPPDLLDRRVEITGPVDRKMIINALNSGAKVFMADFEDSTTPSWSNLMAGQINLMDAVNGSITFTNARTGKTYALQPPCATLMVRPRGWHLPEKHLLYRGEPMSGSLVDFGLFFFHNAQALISRGSGPYFYLPKLEHHLEARLWNDVFIFAQGYLGIPQRTIKATVLIETILASFQMDEILYELRDHSAGLNCGRWDYIFSFIKKFRRQPDRLMPDRAQMGMTAPFMRAYSQLLIQTCHRRGVHAMGGMAAQIPIKNDLAANELALEKVRQDKLREVQDGHDGTWVAHPGLVPVAQQVFDRHMPQPNQINQKSEERQFTAAELLTMPEGTITETGVRQNINVGILYLESWLRGQGAAALYHLMEDAATAEISRTQLWQWIHQGATLADGRSLSPQLYQTLLTDELQKIRHYVGDQAFELGRFPKAIALFNQLIEDPEFTEFLTLPAYDSL